jgi:hypothetical protein
MESIILAYALPDESFAHRLADFLEGNLPVVVSRTGAIVGAGVDLIEAADRALSGDVALVLLSPDSVPGRWNRPAWERVFLEAPAELQTFLGFVLVRDCHFPGLLRKQRFFDATTGEVPAFRQIRQWLFHPHENLRPFPPAAAELEDLRSRIADRAGTDEISPTLAVRFADECRNDFENVYWFDCRKRSRAGIVGDIGGELGLRMAGTTEQNILTLQNWCAGHRVLFVFVGLEAEDREFLPGGRASAIFTSAAGAALHKPVRSATTDAVRAFYDALDSHRGNATSLGWTAVSRLKAQERFMEALEVAGAMAVLAYEFSDASAISRIAREQYWLRYDLGYQDGTVSDGTVTDGTVIGRMLEPGDLQLPLPFEE